MTQGLTRYERYQSDFREFERRLPGDGSSWVHQIRQQALARFSELGFPTATRGNERWKYTNVGPIANATFEYPFELSRDGVGAAAIRRIVPWDDSWVNLVFLDGHYAQALSTAPVEVNGARVMNLAEAFLTCRDVVEQHLGRYATFDEDGFTAVNTAFLQEGAFLYVPQGHALQSPLHLIFVTTERARPIVTHPRTLIVLGESSKLTVLESYVSLSPTSYLTNAVAEIVVGDGAELAHYRFLAESPDAFHVGTTRVYLGRDSTFKSTAFAKGAARARNDILVLLDGPGGSCFLKGLYMTAGTQHIDNHINIDHAKPHTTSHQYFKGILAGRSRAVYSGRILVRKDAQKTNSYQGDKNLLLSEGAEVDSKPSLEIYADDVQCGHGATAGAVAEDALFYMRSRGMDLDTATRFLIQGFASEIIDTIPLAPFRAYLEKLTAGAFSSFRLEEA